MNPSHAASKRSARRSRIWLRALILGMLFTAAGLWVPPLVAWIRPPAPPPKGPGLYSSHGLNIDARDYAGFLTILGYHRLQISPIRGSMVFGPNTTDPELMALADLVRRIDRDAIGPFAGDPFARPGLVVHVHRAGFPFRAVEAWFAEIHDSSGVRTLPVEGGLTLPRNPRVAAPTAILPLRPLLLPLAMNLAVWALVAALALALSKALSRRKAGRLGLCTACGYPKAGIPAGVCTECGLPYAI